MPVLLISLIACGPKVSPTPLAAPTDHALCVEAEAPPPAFSGVLGSGVSTAVYRFTPVDGGLCLDAWDSNGGEWFALQDMALDGGSLSVTSTMPSTSWTNHNVFTAEGAQVTHRWEGQLPGSTTMIPKDAPAPAP